MAAFNFPNSPSTNDVHTENGISWKWNGTVWKKVASPDTIAKADSKVQVVDAGTGGYITAETDGTQRLRIQNSGAIVTGILTSTTFVGALTGNASGSSGSCTGNAATATALQNARTIGGVSFDGTANINLPGVNAAGNQNTSGTSAGLSGTPAITVGAVTASTGQFSGNVNVLGTLTYEDVKNVDSAGIATARQGLRITGGGLDVVGVTTFNDNVKLLDDDKLLLGTGEDFQIYHSSSDNINFIKGANSRNIYLLGDDVAILNQAGNQTGLWANAGASLDLFYANSKKLETTNTGIKVHGGDQAIVAQGSGAVSINIGSTNAGSAAIYFDGDSNGDFVGADYSHIIHNTSGHMEYNADNPSGGTSHIFKTGGTEKVRFESTGKAHFWTGNNDYTNPDIGGSTSGVSIGKNVSGQIYACVDDSSGDYYKNWTMNLCRRNNAGDGPQLALDRSGWVKASIAGLQGGNTASSAAGQFAIYTHDYSSGSHVQTERFRIGTTGKVGIATDNPYAPLSVRTAAETSSSGNFADNGILLHAPGATDEHVIPISASFVTHAYLPRCGIGFISHPTVDPVQGYAGEIGFYTHDAADGSGLSPSNERVRITRGGSVGMGIATPEANLHIYKGDSGGTTAAGVALSIEHSDTATLQFLSPNNKYNSIRFGDNNDNGAGWVQYNHSDNTMQFGTNGGEKMRITSGGLLHVGYNAGSSAGTAAVNIVGAGHGIQVARTQGSSPTDGQDLGSIAFQGYLSGNHTGSADARIDATAAENHSGSTAGTHLKFWTKPPGIGPGSAPLERFRLDKHGTVIVYNSTSTASQSWSTVQHNSSNGLRVHVRYIYAGSSTTTINLFRARRHYWGAGNYKIILKQNYYIATGESNWWLNGHGRNQSGHSPNWSLSHNDLNSSIGSGTINLSSWSNSSPGNDYATYVDVRATISAYNHFVCILECSGNTPYSTDINSIANDGYALH